VNYCNNQKISFFLHIIASKKHFKVTRNLKMCLKKFCEFRPWGLHFCFLQLHSLVVFSTKPLTRTIFSFWYPYWSSPYLFYDHQVSNWPISAAAFTLVTFNCGLNVQSGIDERCCNNDDPEEPVNPRLCVVSNLTKTVNAVVIFTNILRKAFTHIDLKRTIKYSQAISIFCAFRICTHKRFV